MIVNIAEADAILFTYFWTDIDTLRTYLAKKPNAVFSKDTDISGLLDLQYAYNPNPLRATFFSVTDDTTIMFPNLQDGWMSLFYSTAMNTGVKACYAIIMDDKKLLSPANYFYYLDRDVKRVVYTIKEDKWVFHESGTPLPFENTAYYSQKQKKKRLDKSIMLEYCERMNIFDNGSIKLKADGAFTYEHYWEGKRAHEKGAGRTAFQRKGDA